jgi:hypothetical protein
MTKLHTALKALIVVCFTLAIASATQAQATRTWVSGVGDDANPCSRTAPCKTFAGAISKTAVGGEIDCLDPGGFGTVTITKSITIDGCCISSILAGTGAPGITINIAAGGLRRVTIRHLTINGVDVGSKGINIVAASTVMIENCFIQNFTQEGVNAALAESGTYVSIKDTNITNCATGVNITTTTGFDVASLEKVRIEKMTGNGLNICVHGHAHVRDSFIVNNGADGVSMAGGVTDGTANLESTFVASNASAGLRNGGTGSIIDISNTSIMQNGTGIASSSGAAGGGVNSHGNNMISGNAAPGTTPNGVGQQ